MTVRSLSTSYPCLQEDTPTSSAPSSQPQPPQSSTAPKASPWESITRGQRPHPSAQLPSTRDPVTLQGDLDNALDVFDLVDPKGRFPRSSYQSSYQSSSSSPRTLVADISREIDMNDAKLTHDSLDAVHLRLTPMLGRTLAVEPGIGLDLQSAFRTLELRCAANHVKGDNISQRTHVRRGQAKKELRSKRWRALFKEGFLREVARVRRMKGQGW